MDPNDVRVAVYRSFLETGRPPMPVELAAAAGAPLADVEAALRDLAADDVVELVPGTAFVWLAHPFSAAAAPFRVTSGDRTWDAICIWDALGILALAESEGRVETACPDCGEPLAVEVRAGEAVGPPEYLAHYGVPARRWYEDVGYT
ncbi:MAG TPA: organomercurial lyase [Actinomycetota bacterium]|nr:organomercurial lyase [Actinomycetota bacterium]